MKSNLKIFTFFLLLTMSCVALPRQTEAQQSTISLQVFYDELSPYGQWIDYNDYGYVWIPNVNSDFAPYSTDGHWILTEYGWSWSSDYDWGWAAFHYGRWSFNNSFGWFWVPDNEWGPAWVNWRQSDGYYGWSPMEPGISMSVNFGRSYDSNNDHWLFVRDRDFERQDMNRYYVGRSDRDRIARNSTVIRRTYVDRSRNTTYVSGPTRESVQQATGRTIRPLTVREKNKPGQNVRNGQLEIYRPRIDNNNGSRKTAPTRITNQNDVKRTNGRDATNNNQTVIPGSRSTTQPADQRNQQNNNEPAGLDNVNQIVQPINSNKPIRQPNNVEIRNNTQPGQQRNMNQQYNNSQERNINQPVNHDQNIQPAEPNQIRPENIPPVIQDIKKNNGQQNIPRTVNEHRRDVQNNAPAQPRSADQQDNNRPKNVEQNSKNNERQAKEDKSIRQQVKEEQAKIPNKEGRR